MSYFGVKRIKKNKDIFANNKVQMNEIENFQKIAKNRLIKMRRIKNKKFNLH